MARITWTDNPAAYCGRYAIPDSDSIAEIVGIPGESRLFAATMVDGRWSRPFPMAPERWTFDGTRKGFRAIVTTFVAELDAACAAERGKD